MNKQKEILDELKDISTLLYGIKQHSSSPTPTAPENYFNEFEATVLHKIHSEKKENSLLFYLKPIALAASLLGVVVFSIFKFSTLNATTDCVDTLACLNKAEIQHYVLEHIHDFESEEVFNVFESEINANTSFNLEDNTTTTYASSELDSTSIQQYIEANPTSLNDLINTEETYIF